MARSIKEAQLNNGIITSTPSTSDPLAGIFYMVAISVIIPAYNVNEYLGDACNSILSQTFFDWECIIIDDGSIDTTAAIAGRFCKRDSRFRLVRQSNSGVSAVRNLGISLSRGTYMAFLDADDILEADAFELWIKALEDAPECILAWGRALRFEDSSGLVKDIPWKNYLATGRTWHDMLVHDFIPMGTFCLRRTMLPDNCRFRPDLTHAEDRDFILRVLRNNAAVEIKNLVLRIRLRATSASHDSQAAIENELCIMHEHLDDPALPNNIRRRANSALAFRCAVIAAFTGHQYGKSLMWYFKAIVRDPLNINIFLLPLRKGLMVLRQLLRF